MSIQFRTVCPSAHLDSFCRRLSEVADFEFIYQGNDPGEMRRKIGWNVEVAYKNGPITPEANERALKCDVLIEMLREMDLMEARVKAGMTTAYLSERWLKPLVIKGWHFPGILRLLSFRWVSMVHRFVRCMDGPNFWVLPLGVHAARDFARLYGLFHGDLRCIFRPPQVHVDRRLGGRIEGFDRMRLWGYFVEVSKILPASRPPLSGRMLKILWCGRMIRCKRVDILIRAFRRVHNVRPASLLIVGDGPEKSNILALAGNLCLNKLGWEEGRVCFSGYVKSDVVRELMHHADVYVMSSNAEEGWGAAVPEALTEGCPVISTYEAGSSATLLPRKCLYHSNSVLSLSKCIVDFNETTVEYSPDEWSGVHAAEEFLRIIKGSCVR